LNNLPEGKKLNVKKLQKSEKKPTSKRETPPKDVSGKPGGKVVLAKRTAEQPAGWDKVDQVIQLGTVPGLKYDTELIQVKAGTRIRLTLNNGDDMPHNMLLVKPGTANKVGETALQLGFQGMAMNYVPEVEDVLFHTKLVQPGQEDTIYIQVPSEPGDYQFLCTYPGHYLSMRGILRVTK